MVGSLARERKGYTKKIQSIIRGKQMNKLEFKKAYALYRKNVSKAYSLGLDSFRTAINANDLFRSVYMTDVKPVSIKCKMALSDAGLCKF